MFYDEQLKSFYYRFDIPIYSSNTPLTVHIKGGECSLLKSNLYLFRDDDAFAQRDCIKLYTR